MYTVYILYSESIQKFYCGQTNSIENRLIKHNNHEVKSTKHGAPWKIVWTNLLLSRSDAMNLEETIKKRGIKRWMIDNLIKLE
ncbi:MAG: GIY-YIG nuclease family protein [Saprospiraceae bacterium]|nr:GIY-YIG nuclease family protein [Saprospiraceae bacterium]